MRLLGHEIFAEGKDVMHFQKWKTSADISVSYLLKGKHSERVYVVYAMIKFHARALLEWFKVAKSLFYIFNLWNAATLKLCLSLIWDSSVLAL